MFKKKLQCVKKKVEEKNKRNSKIVYPEFYGPDFNPYLT